MLENGLFAEYGHVVQKISCWIAIDILKEKDITELFE